MRLLTDGDGPYMLTQVAINDLIIVFALASIVIPLIGVNGVHTGLNPLHLRGRLHRHPATYALTTVVRTEVKARTMAFDPTTGTTDLPDAKFGPAPAPTAEHPKPRPSILPGSLEILTVTQISPK